MTDKDVSETIAALPCWSSPIEVDALVGGLTNRNFRVTDRHRQSFVVRIGKDIPEHGVMRFNELAAARAAYAAGITPEVIYASKGILVSRFIEGTVLTPALVHWSIDGWKTCVDTNTRDTGLGIHVLDLPTASLPAGSQVVFTFYWPQENRWEGKDYIVMVA